eukprot:Blabericola_migrator_1__4952@NODE_257_length_10777_cov_171_650047_g215_i0_p6_GENE_NODE_257_length_10777_cov_171_650047_g215_i0NODE_257_length_10777_cov_171_650047_g215_i0_p6_ORF_typecomplete_len191_score36_91IMS/PF00817_20/3_3e03IMS/PF00817_20/4_2e05RdRP_4/PF02123_16/0_09PhoU/PF01895_19/0_28PhoU/PF01895_19/1_9e03_NODE_257_length_10777_cov_171_650047_g215_i019472519
MVEDGDDLVEEISSTEVIVQSGDNESAESIEEIDDAINANEFESVDYLQDESHTRRHLDAKDLLECLGDRAGMEGVNRDRIKQIVHDASVGSKFYENEKRRAKQLEDTVNALVSKKEFYETKCEPQFREAQRKKAQAFINSLLAQYEVAPGPVWVGNCFCHVDMDMFFCAVEQLEEPALKEVPMAVGGAS